MCSLFCIFASMRRPSPWEPHPFDSMELHDALKKHWGYDGFRGAQLQTIGSVMAGRDTLALMPTGAGKSITYQLPAMVSEGLCIVVTPLIALMKDQVDALRSRGIPAASIHSGMTARNIDITLDNCVYGDVKFLYVAPERIAGETFLVRLSRMKLCLIAVDEAHCISQWGYDFRPSYLKIARIREVHPDVPVLALTASATGGVAEDIMDKLCFREKNVIRSDFSRPNLSFSVRHTDDKKEQLLRVLNNVPGSGIVYMRTRDGAELLARELKEEGVSADYYHAGLPHAERGLRQNEWITGKTRVIVATTAFGMGIDKADVRFVVHYDLCSSPEEYYQEAGRAGRDGRRSYAVLLVSSDEREKHTRRFDAEFPHPDRIRDIYEKMCNYLQIATGEGKHYSAAFNIYDFCARYRLFGGAVHNALKILQQNGYLVYSEEDENPARLMFCVSRDDLYSLRVQRDDLDHILRTILRLYTGVFSDFRPIDTQELAVYTGYTEERVKELLKTLWQLHVIRYIPKNRSPMVFMLEGRLPPQDIYISPETYRIRKDMAAERLNAVFDYADNEEKCRSVMLQEYFGQEDAAPCGVCDVCLSRRKKTKGGDDGLRRRIVAALREGPAGVKELVNRFPADASRIVAELDTLIAEGAAFTDEKGEIRLK